MGNKIVLISLPKPTSNGHDVTPKTPLSILHSSTLLLPLVTGNSLESVIALPPPPSASNILTEDVSHLLARNSTSSTFSDAFNTTAYDGTYPKSALPSKYHT